jgi:hypothetical protein
MNLKNMGAVAASGRGDINRAGVIDLTKTYSFLAPDDFCHTTGAYLNIDSGMSFS